MENEELKRLWFKSCCAAKPFPLELHPWHVIVRSLWPFDFCQAIVIVASPETIQLLESLSYTFQVHSQQEKIGPFSDKRSVGVQLQCIIYCQFLASSIHFGSLQTFTNALDEWLKQKTNISIKCCASIRGNIEGGYAYILNLGAVYLAAARSLLYPSLTKLLDPK